MHESPVRSAAVAVLAAAGVAAQEAGTRDMQEACTRGLAWLASRQLEDGRWSDGEGSSHDAATTALALLALGASGNTLHVGRGADALARGATWLASALDECGAIVPTPRYRRNLDQALVAWALTEVVFSSRVTKDDPLHAAATKALTTLAAARRTTGRWETEFSPGEVDTCLVTAWAGVVLFAADQFDLRSNEEDAPLEIVAGEGTAIAPETRGLHSARLLLSALRRVAAGDPESELALVDLEAVAADAGAARDDPFARQLAVWGAFWAGGKGEAWERVRDRVRPAFEQLVAAQADDGSWPASDRWRADGGGDVSSTALAILTLRVACRLTRVR